MTKQYALFKDGQQVSKSHHHRATVYIEAIEQKAAWLHHGDFTGDDLGGVELADGYEIKEVEV